MVKIQTDPFQPWPLGHFELVQYNTLLIHFDRDDFGYLVRPDFVVVFLCPQFFLQENSHSYFLLPFFIPSS